MLDSPTRTGDGLPVSQKDATQVFETSTGSGPLILRPTSDRYELHDEIARGGMGIILAARDTALNREVAIKLLREEYRVHAIIQSRFVEEAHITAQLQHPGIPPVHDLGTLPDGRPFLAMKLIKGRTLTDLLEHDRPELPHLLEIFEKVCLTVAFAHSKSVIHRDLKPGNVMVGSFGEVQVMDWGLAKLMRNTDGETLTAAPEPDGPPLSELDIPTLASETQAGSLLGTPAYIPPEQARGDIAATGTPADVFALGAILCELLTNDPPYIGSVPEVRGFAIAGHLAPAHARLDACKADPELIALTKRCLRGNPAERPADAKAVADSVSAYRDGVEDRLRIAEVERARAEAKAVEQKKRRYIQLLLAAAVVGLLVVFGFAAWQWEKQRAEAAQREADAEADAKVDEAMLAMRQRVTEQNVVEALAKMQSLREEGWKQADDPARWRLTLVAAAAAYEQAEALLIKGEPTDELRTRVAVESRGLALDHKDRLLLADLDQLWEESQAGQFIPFLMNRSVVDRYATTFRNAGFDPVTDSTESLTNWIKQQRFRNRITVAMRNWSHALAETDIFGLGRDLGVIQASFASPAVAGNAAPHALLTRPSRTEKLQAVLDAVTDNPFERDWWKAVRAKDTATLDRLMRTPEIDKLTARQLGGLADGLATFKYMPGWFGMHRFLDLAYDRYPGEFWVNFRLGQRNYDEPTKRPGPLRAADGLRHLTAAVAAKPQSALARVALGVALMEQRKDVETATRLFRSAAEIDPTSVWPPLVQAMMSGEYGKWDVAALQQAVRLDPDTAFAMIQPNLITRYLVPGAHNHSADPAPIIDALIAARPDHPGGYDMRGEYKMTTGDVRGAIADLNMAKARMRPEYLRRTLIQMQLLQLESLASWEAKLPAVLRGELKLPPGELAELAKYVATFDRRYVLATRFATDALAAAPELLTKPSQTGTVLSFQYYGVQFMSWAVQAAAGKGTDAANLTDAERSRLRKQALAWGREILTKSDPSVRPILLSSLNAGSELQAVRDAKARLLLPADERAEWLQFWLDVRQAGGKGSREMAPPPRPVER